MSRLVVPIIGKKLWRTGDVKLSADLNLSLKDAAGQGHSRSFALIAEVRSGYLRFQVAGMDQTEHVVPCLFLGEPDQPPSGPQATLPRMLLQPLALLDSLRFVMEKDPNSTAIYGHLVVQKT